MTLMPYPLTTDQLSPLYIVKVLIIHMKIKQKMEKLLLISLVQIKDTPSVTTAVVMIDTILNRIQQL